jgi:hypothetical protein
MIEFKQGMNPYDTMGIGLFNSIKDGDIIKVLVPLYYKRICNIKDIGHYTTNSEKTELRFKPGDLLNFSDFDNTFNGAYDGSGNPFIPLDWVKKHQQYFQLH